MNIFGMSKWELLLIMVAVLVIIGPDRLPAAMDNLRRWVRQARDMANQAKGDKLPSEWMPEARRSRCAYGHRMVNVAKHYALPLPRADMRAIRRSCSGVAGLIARREL